MFSHFYNIYMDNHDSCLRHYINYLYSRTSLYIHIARDIGTTIHEPSYTCGLMYIRHSTRHSNIPTYYTDLLHIHGSLQCTKIKGVFHRGVSMSTSLPQLKLRGYSLLNVNILLNALKIAKEKYIFCIRNTMIIIPKITC